jgi:hypothetical protein
VKCLLGTPDEPELYVLVEALRERQQGGCEAPTGLKDWTSMKGGYVVAPETQADED